MGSQNRPEKEPQYETDDFVEIRFPPRRQYDFSRFWGAQNEPKIDPENYVKNYSILEPLGLLLGSLFALKMAETRLGISLVAAKSRSRALLFRPWSLSGALQQSFRRAPRGAQEAKTLQEASREPFGKGFVRFGFRLRLIWPDCTSQDGVS